VQNLGGSLSHSGEALRFRDVNYSEADVSVPDQRVDPPPAILVTDAFPLPRLFRVGLNYDIISNESTTLALMSEFIESNNTNAAFGFGSEFRWQGVDTPIGVALRASYQTQPDNNEDFATAIETSQGSDGLGLGGGLFYRFAGSYRVQFDYAYKNYGVLGSANAFSVTFGVD